MSSSLKTLCKSFLTASQILLLSSSKQALGGSPPTCSNPQTSCQNTTAVQDTCCFNSPGGQLLQTQFWDVSPAVGPTDSWTIHGLWPDHCDGTYDATCDPNRQYTNITAILTAAGQTSLLSYMNTYWKPNAGTDESFWEHEWGKHGTCISTLEPNCYTSYAPQEEVVDFFTQTVSLFQSLPSYTWLSNAGIVPSSTATYTSAAILAALETPRGVTAVIRCANTNQLDEIWYFYDVSGSVQTGTFVPVNPSGATSNCPATGVQYLPKSGGSPAPTSSDPIAPDPTPTITTPAGGEPTTAPGLPFSGAGTLPVLYGGNTDGCIISGGTWYIGGTCAKFTATPAGDGFTLSSSKGKCAVENNNLVCSSGVTTATVFTNSGDDLAYSGSPSFYAGSVPAGSTQVTVSTAKLADSLAIQWQAS